MHPNSRTLSAGNLLLSTMPVEVLEPLSRQLESIDLPQGTYLYRSLQPIEYVYFIDTGIASILATASDGSSIEAGMVGFEGAAGCEVLLGVDDSPHSCVIQVAGAGRRIAADAARMEFSRNEKLRKHLLLFIHKLSTQVSQTALCNRIHHIEQRLAKWLLMSHDRVEGDVLPLTHEYLSIMLGVSRVTVSLTAAGFQNLEMVKYSRGAITIIDRPQMERMACECYSMIAHEYQRGLPEA